MVQVRAGAILLTIGLFLAGCGSEEVPPLPSWSATVPVHVPQPSSGNAFDEYALAALDVEAKGGSNLTRTFFYPGHIQESRKATAEAIRTVRRATNRPCDFRFMPRRPFEPAPYQQGWRLIGRVLTWSIQEAIEEERYDEAIDSAVLATRFGFDLSGGGATDASLGLTIVDEARRALAPVLGRLEPAQLTRLSQGYKSALERKPPLSLVVEHERLAMLEAVQYVQDAFLSGDYAELRRGLGQDAREAVRYLEGLRDEPHERWMAYFAGFAAEAEEEAGALRRLAALPARERAGDPGPALRDERPWRRFARHFFRSTRPLLDIDDATVARTRLMILESEILRQAKQTGAVPLSLDGFTKSLIIDPYTGLPFKYRGEGTVFDLYSVGADFRDDGGVTDSTFTAKDLRLERPTP
jgi:hypothetical protein